MHILSPVQAILHIQPYLRRQISWQAETMWNPTSYPFDLLTISTNLRIQANQANQINELSIYIVIDLWHLSRRLLTVALLILLQCLRLVSSIAIKKGATSVYPFTTSMASESTTAGAHSHLAGLPMRVGTGEQRNMSLFFGSLYDLAQSRGSAGSQGQLQQLLSMKLMGAEKYPSRRAPGSVPGVG